MNARLAELAKELGLMKEYKTIRVAGGELVKVEDKISEEHRRILQAAYEAGAEDEREACAKVCEVQARGWKKNPGKDDSGYIASSNCAAVIRARGEKE
jgi:hypothetical protein